MPKITNQDQVTKLKSALTESNKDMTNRTTATGVMFVRDCVVTDNFYIGEDSFRALLEKNNEYHEINVALTQRKTPDHQKALTCAQNLMLAYARKKNPNSNEDNLKKQINNIQKYESQNAGALINLLAVTNPLAPISFVDFLTTKIRGIKLNNLKTTVFLNEQQQFVFRISCEFITQDPQISLGHAHQDLIATDHGFEYVTDKQGNIEYVIENPVLADLANSDNPDTEYQKQFDLLRRAAFLHQVKHPRVTEEDEEKLNSAVEKNGVLLNSFVEKHKNAIKSYALDLANADLANADLANADLTGVHLDNRTDFEGAITTNLTWDEKKEFTYDIDDTRDENNQHPAQLASLTTTLDNFFVAFEKSLGKNHCYLTETLNKMASEKGRQFLILRQYVRDNPDTDVANAFKETYYNLYAKQEEKTVASLSRRERLLEFFQMSVDPQIVLAKVRLQHQGGVVEQPTDDAALKQKRNAAIDVALSKISLDAESKFERDFFTTTGANLVATKESGKKIALRDYVGNLEESTLILFLEQTTKQPAPEKSPIASRQDSNADFNELVRILIGEDTWSNLSSEQRVAKIFGDKTVLTSEEEKFTTTKKESLSSKRNALIAKFRSVLATNWLRDTYYPARAGTVAPDDLDDKAKVFFDAYNQLAVTAGRVTGVASALQEKLTQCGMTIKESEDSSFSVCQIEQGFGLDCKVNAPSIQIVEGTSIRSLPLGGEVSYVLAAGNNHKLQSVDCTVSGNPALAALYASPDDPQLQFNVLQQAVGCALAMPKESRDASLPSPQALLNLLVDFAKAVKVPCVLPKNADFSGENCQNYLPDKVDFNGANLSGANLSGCTIDNFTNFSGAIMKNLVVDAAKPITYVVRDAKGDVVSAMSIKPDVLWKKYLKPALEKRGNNTTENFLYLMNKPNYSDAQKGMAALMMAQELDKKTPDDIGFQKTVHSALIQARYDQWKVTQGEKCAIAAAVTDIANFSRGLGVPLPVVKAPFDYSNLESLNGCTITGKEFARLAQMLINIKSSKLRTFFQGVKIVGEIPGIKFGDSETDKIDLATADLSRAEFTNFKTKIYSAVSFNNTTLNPKTIAQLRAVSVASATNQVKLISGIEKLFPNSSDNATRVNCSQLEIVIALFKQEASSSEDFISSLQKKLILESKKLDNQERCKTLSSYIKLCQWIEAQGGADALIDLSEDDLKQKLQKAQNKKTCEFFGMRPNGPLVDVPPNWITSLQNKVAELKPQPVTQSRVM